MLRCLSVNQSGGEHRAERLHPRMPVCLTEHPYWDQTQDVKPAHKTSNRTVKVVGSLPTFVAGNRAQIYDFSGKLRQTGKLQATGAPGLGGSKRVYPSRHPDAIGAPKVLRKAVIGDVKEAGIMYITMEQVGGTCFHCAFVSIPAGQSDNRPLRRLPRVSFESSPNQSRVGSPILDQKRT